jgi:hypothetical protein
MGAGGKTRTRSIGPDALWRRRTSREPSRENAAREEIDGEDSQDEPKTMKEAMTEQQLRPSPGRVRKTPEGIRKEPVGGAPNEQDALPPVPAGLEGQGNVRRGVSARLKRCAEAAGMSQSSGGEPRGSSAPSSVPHSVR